MQFRRNEMVNKRIEYEEPISAYLEPKYVNIYCE